VYRAYILFELLFHNRIFPECVNMYCDHRVRQCLICDMQLLYELFNMIIAILHAKN